MTTTNSPVLARQPVILTIHDLSVMHFPHQFPVWFRTYFRIMLPVVADRAAHIVTNSEFTRDDVLRTLKVRPERVTAVRLGVDHGHFRPHTQTASGTGLKERFGVRRPYFLSVGTISPRKNLRRLMEAFALLLDQLDTPHKLVFVGMAGWKEQSISQLARNYGVEERVQQLHYVPRESMPLLYSAAEALVFPSTFEGFGLPVLEAMACGCPVLVSQAGSLPEVVGGAGEFFDPYSVESIVNAMHRILTEDGLAESLRQHGIERAAEYSWAKTAAKTQELYLECAT